MSGTGVPYLQRPAVDSSPIAADPTRLTYVEPHWRPGLELPPDVAAFQSKRSRVPVSDAKK